MLTCNTLRIILLISPLAQTERLSAQNANCDTVIVKTDAGVIRMDTVRIKSGNFKMGMSREELDQAKAVIAELLKILEAMWRAGPMLYKV